jgi:hypothetical protein
LKGKYMIAIKGSIPAKTLKTYQAKKPIGSPGQGTTNIPINTPNFNGNRTPKGSILAKYLQGNDGFHWGLFGSPLVARLPDGTLEIYDGGHRVSMLQQLYPDVKTFPGTIIDVEDKAEISRLFYRVNGGAASFVNPETRFINQVLGEEVGVDKYIDVLEKANVTIYESEENYVPQTVKPKWKMNIKPLEDIVDLDKNLAVWALNLYTTAWGQVVSETSNGIAITGQIVKGLHQLGITYKDYFNTKQGLERFENWFITMVGLSPSKSDWLFSTEFKHERMELRHLGTALGIMTKYAAYARVRYNSSAPSADAIKSLYKSHDAKRAKKNGQQTVEVTDE